MNISPIKITIDSRLCSKITLGDVQPIHSNMSCGPKKIIGINETTFAFKIALNTTIHSSMSKMTPHLWPEVRTSSGVPTF